MSLTGCLKKAGSYLHPDDKAAILAAAREHRSTGLSNDDAGRKAITDRLAEVSHPDFLKSLNTTPAPEGIADKPGPAKPEAAPEEPIKEIKQRDTRKASAMARRSMGLNVDDSLLTALAKFGGVNRDSAREHLGVSKDSFGFTVKSGNLTGYPFRKQGGMSADRALETLVEAGYLYDIPADDQMRGFEDAVSDELGGSAHFTAEGHTHRAQAMDRMERQAQDEADEASKEPPALDEIEAKELDDTLRAAVLSEADLAAMTNDDVDDLMREPKASIMRALGFDDEEISHAEQTDAQRSAAKGAESSDSAAQTPGEPRSGEARAQPALALESQDAEGLKAKTERESAATAADKAEQKRLADKASADAQRGEFTLTGSDRAADVAAAAGQGDIFAAPVPVTTPTPAPAPRNSTAARARAARAAKLADYFAPGNVLDGYGGPDEVLSYTPADENGRWSVTVQAVKNVDGQWVRIGKPQDARAHATEPNQRELAKGPLARLGPQAAGEVKYTEPRADGKPFPNAVPRGAFVESVQAAPTSKTIEDFGEKIAGARKDYAATLKEDRAEYDATNGKARAAADTALSEINARVGSESVRGNSDAVQRRAQVTANAVTGPLERAGVAALVGSKVGSSADLATLAQVYRDPRFETLRIFMVKNGEIVHATGVSSRMPGEAPFVPKDTTYEAYKQQLLDLMKTSGADGYYLLHNHPSGNPTPSGEDLRLTHAVGKDIPGLLSHVVINGGHYAIISPRLDTTVVSKDFGPEQLLVASKPSPVLGTALRSPEVLATLGKSMQRPGYITMIGRGADGNVRMVSEAPSSVLTRPYPYLAALVRRSMRLSGSPSVFLVGEDADINSAPVRAALKSGILLDAISNAGESVRSQNVAETFGQGFDTKGLAVREGAVDKLRGLTQRRSEYVAGQTTRQYTAAQTTAMKNVGFQVTQPSLKDRAKALWKDAGKKLAQGLTDQFLPVKDISKEAYGLLRLSKGASGAFQAVLRGGQLKLADGVYDFDTAKRGGVVDKLLIPLQGEHQDFLRWVAANRAERLAGEGKENLFSEADIGALKSLDQGVAPFDYTIQHGANKGLVTRDRSLIYPDSLRTFNEFHGNILDLAEKSGLIDPDGRKSWEHEFYVPFYRVDDEEGGVRNMNIKSGVVRQQAFKLLKGGDQKLNADLLDNTLMNWAHLLDASSKNRAAAATIEAAEKMGIAQQSVAGTKNAVWYMDKGQKRYSVVDDPYVLTAINSLQDTGMNGPVIDAMKTMKRVITFATTISPFFKTRLLLRDTVTAMATSPIPINPAKNLIDGWKLTDPHSDSYFRLLGGGGMIHFGSMMEGSEAARVQQLVASGIEDSTILGNETKVGEFYRRYLRPAITAYTDLSERAEAINRASVYNELIKGGMSHADASLQARDLMDFSRQGSFASIRLLSSVVPFFNARLQGLDKIVRATREDPARASAVIGATALVSLGLLAMYHDDDDWKKRPDWDRNNYWWFKVGGTAFRIPKPFEIGAMATLAERSFERVFDKEMTNKRFMAQIAALAGNQLSMNPVPQLVKPLLDVYANIDSFTGRQIESEHMRGLQSEYRFNSSTSMASRAASTAANALTEPLGVSGPSPLQLDHLLQGYFGWLGMFIVQAGDTVARPMTGQPSQPAPDYLKTATGGMVQGDLRDAQSRYIDQVYEQGKVIQQAYATMRELRKEGKTAEAADFQKENADDLSKYKGLQHVQATESKLNAQIKIVEASDKNPDEKRTAIRALRYQQDRTARAFSPAN